MIAFSKIGNVENMVWIVYFIIVYYARTIQSDEKILPLNFNNRYISNEIMTMTKLVKNSRDFVSRNTVTYDFQQLSNSTLIAHNYTTFKCKTILSHVEFYIKRILILFLFSETANILSIEYLLVSSIAIDKSIRKSYDTDWLFFSNS
jgi:hypothetical protein